MGERKSPAERRRRTSVRNVALLLGLVAIAALMDPAIVAPVGPLAAPPEQVGATFVRCGQPGRHFACVVDGDTLRLGTRRVRLTGIDAPELAKPQCREEGALADRSANRLVELLNQGPFKMVAHRFHGRDRHGRDLRNLIRGNSNIGTTLIDEGLAHRFWGVRTGWC